MPVSSADGGPDVAVCDDAADDVTDPDGNRAPNVPVGMDLVRVVLTRANHELTVTFETNPPATLTTDEASGLFWAVEAFADEETGYQLRVALDGEAWSVDVFDYGELENHSVPVQPGVSDGVLSVPFPLDLVPALEQSFHWSAGTEWGDLTLYNDSCPGPGGPTVESENQLSFPG